MQLYEKYRPKRWDQVIGQDKVIHRLLTLRNRSGLGGRAYWIAGGSGQGKTTIARLIASEVADEWTTEELDAQCLTPARVLEFERKSQIRPFSGGWAFLVNEAHGLSKPAVRQLLVTLERIPSHVVWLFTTTKNGQEKLFEDCIDAGPLLSRCVVLVLTNQGLCEAFAKHLKRVAETEGFDGAPLEAYRQLLKRCRNNLRAAFQALESGDM